MALLPRGAFRTKLRGCTCRSFASSSTAHAPFNFTPLPERSLLSISGSDAPKFLQGLISNDVNHLGKPGSPTERLLFAAIMKADGRMLHDIFLLPSPDFSPSTPSYEIDHDTLQSEDLRKYLKRHILRSKVKLARTAEAERSVCAAWRSDDESSESEIKEAEDWLRAQGAGEDHRAPGMGWRWSGPVATESEPPSNLFQQVSPAHFQLHRLTLAVPEGHLDWPQLPLEANLELMGGVDYKKGCYVGQELTARTHHKGVVRKRGVSLRLFREGEEVPDTLLPTFKPLSPYPNLFPLPPSTSTLSPLNSKSSRPRPSGKMGSSLPIISRSGASSAIAFASVRLEHLGDGGPEDGIFVVKAALDPGAEVGDGAGESEEEGGRWLAKAFLPDWVKSKLEASEK